MPHFLKPSDRFSVNKQTTNGVSLFITSERQLMFALLLKV